VTDGHNAAVSGQKYGDLLSIGIKKPTSETASNLIQINTARSYSCYSENRLNRREPKAGFYCVNKFYNKIVYFFISQ